MATAASSKKKRVDLTTTVSLSAMVFAPYKVKKGEEYMSLGQVKHFQAILVYLKKELMMHTDVTMHHMQHDSVNLPDPIDLTAKTDEINLELRARDRERKLIKKIDKTLEKNHQS